MSHDALLSLKLERPHGSIEVTERALWRQKQRRWLQGEFFYLSLSPSLTLPYRGTGKAKGRGVQGREKTTGLKKEVGAIQGSNHPHLMRLQKRLVTS
jgi:hypothetical protein